MLLATTSFTPAATSLYGACSRDEPHPLDVPLTTTEKPPFFTASGLTLPPRRPDERIPPERLVVVVADPPRRDLVGRDVADERSVGVEGEVLAGELRLEQRGVFGQKEDAAGEGERWGRPS